MTAARLMRLQPLATVFVIAGCNQLLDVQDAHVDPTLLPGAAGKAGSSFMSDAGRGGDGQGGSGLPQTGGTANAGRGGTSGDAGSDSEDGGAPPSTGGTGTAGAGNQGALGGSGGSSAGGKGGTANGGTGNTTTGEAGGDNEPELTLCERYCDAVMTNCKGRYEQYRDFAGCVDVCRAMTPGSPGDRDMDTVECRLRQAGLAESEPFVYCASSGPLGAGECGSNCATYCNLIQTACTAETTEGNLEPSYFDTTEDCLAACTALVPDENTPDQYTTSATVDPVCYIGNHVYCRTFHVTSAIVEGAPDEHCPHAMGASPCSP